MPYPADETTESAYDLRPKALGGGRLPGLSERRSAVGMSTTTGRGRRLVLLRMVGKGGFGEVYEGRLETPGGLSRRVAVKLLRSDVVDEDALARTIDEAHLLAQLSHPTIVAVEDLIHVDDRLAIVSEYVDGADLSERLPLPPIAALEVMARVAEALHAGWSTTGRSGEPLRIVHRDLKPSNIRLGPHGVVKLLDFGIARPGSGPRRVQTGSGLLVGSMGYVAPERWLGTSEGHASDIYALGCVLIEALSGEPFYQRLPPVRQLAIASDLERHTEHVRQQLAATPQEPGLEALLRAMLAWEPEDRPTALQVAGRCRRVARALDGEGLLEWSGTIRVPSTNWSTADGTVISETDSGFTVSGLVPVEAESQSTSTEPPSADTLRQSGPAAMATDTPDGGTASGVKTEWVREATPAPDTRPAAEADSGPTDVEASVRDVAAAPSADSERHRGGLAGVLMAATGVVVLGLGALALVAVAGVSASWWFMGGGAGSSASAVETPDGATASSEERDQVAVDDGAPDGAGVAAAGGSADAPEPVDDTLDEGGPARAAADVGEAAGMDSSGRAPAGRADLVEAPVVGETPTPALSTAKPTATEPAPSTAPPSTAASSTAAPSTAAPSTAASVRPAEPASSGAAGPTGLVQVEGNTRVRLRGAGGFQPVGVVPVGTYTLEASFDPGVWTSESWTLEVGEGDVVRWVCRQRFRRCMVAQ